MSAKTVQLTVPSGEGDDIPLRAAKPKTRGRSSTYQRSSVRMDIAMMGSEAFEGSVRSLWGEGNRIVKLCLGPGIKISLILGYQVFMNVLANVAFGVVASGLILMFYGDHPTTVTPSQIAAGLLFFALFLAANRMIEAFVLSHSGSWFMRRAKYAIKKMADLKAEEERAEVMAHLVNARNLYITSWSKSTTNLCTEFIAICVVAFFSVELFLVGSGLFVFGKVLSSFDDMYLVREQHKIFDIAKQVRKNADSDVTMHARFFHNHTSAPHILVKLGHILFAYMSPVIFFFAATKISMNGSITLAGAMSSCIFYIIAANCALLEHGSTTRTIKKLYSTSKLVAFDKKYGGVFKTYIDNPDPEIPTGDSASKVSTQFTYSYTEKIGFVFTFFTILCIVVGGTIFTTQAGIDLSCGSVEVTCGHVPDDGANVYIDVDANFSFRQGCTMSKSISEVVDLCAEAVLNMEIVEQPESLTYDEAEADIEELDLELEAIQGLQSEADVTSTEQLLGGSQQRVMISAKFSTWSDSASYQQAYSVVSSSSDSRRRLNVGGDYGLGAIGAPVVATALDSVVSANLDHIVTLTVGLGRHDGTKDAISGYFVGTEGTSGIFELGKKNTFKNKGDIIEVSVSLWDPIGTPTGIGLISGGKDGLKFSSIEVDGNYVGAMKTYSKCRGSKRKGTWNCESTIPLLPPSDGGCVPECSASAQPDPPDLSVITNGYVAGSDTSDITYDFGTVWNNCDGKGSFRFTHTAKCDEGCEERYHSFYLSPTSYFGSSSAGCQQTSTSAYPNYCDDGTLYSSSCTGKKVSHDRGHLIPANNFDNDKNVLKQTNYMINIMPQAAQMNRGAWLKTEMMVECWRNEAPISVVGGAVYIEDCTGNDCEVPEWVDSSGNKVDRVSWFMASHGVKNPAYFWKMIIRAPAGQPQEHIAFWMPNHESAAASKIDDYVVSVVELEANLTKWGATESFNLQGDKSAKISAVGSKWAEPNGCFRG